jgi:hypothetical protein
LYIIGEVLLPIQFSFVTNANSLNDVQKLFVQFVAKNQCSEFIESLGTIEIITTESNIKSLEGTEGDKSSLSGAIVPINAFSKNSFKYTKENVNDFNLVKALTAGFEEPYSLTFFLGRMMVFSKNNGERVGKNRAYLGYLLTVGDKTIKDNKSYTDKWANFEFKLKGTRDKKNRDLDWSFRAGARWHSRADFVDTFYVGARRSSIDYNKSIFSLFYNTTFTTLFSFRIDNQRMTDAEIVGGKIFPTSIEGLSFGLELGYLYTSQYKYDGILRDDGIDKHQAIFRPNFKWKI